jgi:hypothetical protein
MARSSSAGAPVKNRHKPHFIMLHAGASCCIIHRQYLHLCQFRVSWRYVWQHLISLILLPQRCQGGGFG